MLKFCAFFGLSAAWWDHGHMLCPRIAREIMGEEGKASIELVETLMELWQATGDLAGTHEILRKFEFLGPYPDYMKSENPQELADGEVMLRAIRERQFDSIHYWNCPFPIEKIHCGGKEGPGECASAGCTDPEDICAVGDNTDHWPDRDNNDWGEWKHDGIVGFMEYQWRNLICRNTCSAPDEINKEWNTHGHRWSLSSYMRQLALFIHTFGDAHQPLHVGGIKSSSCYPDTDLGGNLVKMNDATHPLFRSLQENDETKISNLHSLWDSFMWYEGSVDGEEDLPALSRTGYLPTYADDLIEPDNVLDKDAKSILDEFPEATFTEEQLNADFLQIGEQTHKLNREVAFDVAKMPYRVWGGCDLSDPDPDLQVKPIHFDPTDEYMIQAHKTSKRQISLCGHRLARRLPEIIQDIPFEGFIEQAQAGFNTAMGKNLCDGLCEVPATTRGVTTGAPPSTDSTAPTESTTPPLTSSSETSSETSTTDETRRPSSATFASVTAIASCLFL